MSDSTTEQQHVDAVVTAFTAALGDKAPPLLADELQRLDAEGQKPDAYVELTVSRRYGGTARASGRNGTQGWRITARYVDHWFIENARTMRTAVRAGLEERRLTINGRLTTLVRFETADDIADDDGWYSGLDSWTYAIGTNPS